MLHSSVLHARRTAGAVIVGLSIAGCSMNGAVAPSGAGDQSGRTGSASVRHNQLLASGLARVQPSQTTLRGWLSPDARRKKSLIYWGNYYNSTITVYSAKGTNPPEKGQITTGLSNPERLFIDKSLNVYATNLGNNTITAYKRGATSPFLTISDGVNSPTGLTVDAAGTVYCANVGNNTVTEYPKGQTSPSLTIPMGSNTPEYLAVDSADNLYVSAGNVVMEFPPGSTKGKDLGLVIGAPWALEVDKSGNIVIIDEAANTIDVFPHGQTQPSKKIAVTAGSAFGLSLNKSETQLLVTVEVTGGFIVQTLAYPNGTSLTDKIDNSLTVGNWPIAVSPDAVL